MEDFRGGRITDIEGYRFFETIKEYGKLRRIRGKK